MHSNLEQQITYLVPEELETKPVQYLWDDNLAANQIASDAEVRASPGWGYTIFHGAEVRADYMLYADGEIVIDDTFHPSYTRPWYEQGFIDNQNFNYDVPSQKVIEAAFIVSHFNMKTYGHFLLEVLPRVFVAKYISENLGLDIPILLPTCVQAPWISEIIKEVCPNLRLELYDPISEIAHVETAYMVTLPLSSNHVLHPKLRSSFEGFSNICVARALQEGLVLPEKVFLSRLGVSSFRHLENERELFEISQRVGFELVNPADMA